MASPPLSIKLRCASWKQLAAIYERDLKRSAVFLKSASPPPTGTPVRINLTLPTQTLIILNGTVERHIGVGELNGRGPGVDIELHSVPQSAMWIIESALDAARRERDEQDDAASPGAEDADIQDGEQLVAAEDDLLSSLTGELESLRKLNPFQVLGVGYETSDDEIHASFASLTKRYHPDRFARYESGEARQIAAEIFILIRNAYQQLENPTARAQVAQQLQHRRGAPRPIRPAPPPIQPAPPPIQTREATPQAPPAVPDQQPDPSPGAKPADPKPAAGPHDAPADQTAHSEAPAAATGPTSDSVRRAIPPPPPSADTRTPVETPADAPRSTDTASQPAVSASPAKPDQSGTKAGTRNKAGENPDSPYARGNALLDGGDYSEAIKVFKVAYRRNPGDQQAKIGLELAEGMKALADRDRLEAAQRFEYVLEMDPDNPRAARVLAEMRRQATEERKNLLSRLLKQRD